MLHITLSILTLNSDLAHVRHIKETDMFAYCHVLRCDSCVLIEQRHVEASKGHHRST